MLNLTKFFYTQKISIGMLFAVFALTIIVATWHFWRWMPTVFAGDDLGNFLAYMDGHFASSVHQALSAVYFEKYRPVFGLMMFALDSLFGDHIIGYLIANLLLQGINATAVYLIAFRLSKGNWLISCLIALSVAGSRFALYQVVQVTGLVESLALVFFLLTLYFMLRADESKKSAYLWAWLSVIAALLALNTHERYIVLIPWIITATLLVPNIRLFSVTRKTVLISSTLLLTSVNIFYKKIIMQVPFFVGTGESLISFKLHSIFMLFLQAIFSIFGFNRGPESFVGIELSSLYWFPSWIFAIAISLCWLLTVIKGIHFAFNEKQTLRWPLLLTILLVLVLMPPLMTIHLEQRWLVEPFILILMLFVWGLNKISYRTPVFAIVLALLMSISSIGFDFIISPYFYRMFFIESSHFNSMVKRDIVDKYPGQKIGIAFISNKYNCSWSLQNGDFFRLYGGTSRPVYCFANLNDALKSTLISANIPIYKITSSDATGHLIDIRSP